MQTFLKKGDEHYKKYEIINAVNSYKKAFELAPDNYEVLLKLTRTYNDAGEEFKELRNREEAEKYINKAVEYAEIFKKKYPDSAAVYTYLAMSYGNIAMFKGGKEKVKYAQMIRQNLDISLKKNPNDYLPYVILGIYNREIASLSWIERLFANTFFGEVPEGSYEESEKLFLKALKLQPDMIVATFQLARTYRKLEREQDEIKMLKKVLALPKQDFRDKFAKEKSQRRLTELGQI
ncbi:MAG: hypothetical protein IPM56_00805 [Ignavibacteriales bacterium]|nr:MAG: hypothetical protein IPM56_00805 [Ignavibacteriales bacterium]